MARSAFIGFCGLAGLLSAGAALAQEAHPRYLPTHDVAVTYSVDQRAGVPKQAHMWYSAGTDRLRLESPNQKGFVLIDRAAKTMTVVMAPQHIYFQTPLDPDMAVGFILNEHMKFARAGTQTIAGRGCTVWNVESPRASGTVCVTDDGVLLLGRGRDKDGTGGGLQATEVSYAPQPATLFVPPADFRKIDIRQMPPGNLPQ